jgi:hypothetical protein
MIERQLRLFARGLRFEAIRTAAEGSSSGCLWFVATIVAFIAISIAAVVIFGDF